MQCHKRVWLQRLVLFRVATCMCVFDRYVRCAITIRIGFGLVICSDDRESMDASNEAIIPTKYKIDMATRRQVRLRRRTSFDLGFDQSPYTKDEGVKRWKLMG
jgi:hypothetical protein